jgi:hypothetical protein
MLPNPDVVADITVVSRPNSIITCRQMPHGWIGRTVSATRASEEIVFSPANTALAIAILSAQIVAEYDEFSTLQPTKTRPELDNAAAPTLNFEYGAYALSRARVAASISFLTSSEQESMSRTQRLIYDINRR